MQFSLKTLMFAVLAAAVVCGIFFGLPVVLSLVVLWVIVALLPAIFVPWIVYGRGYGRAFAIGCATTGLCIPVVNIILLTYLSPYRATVGYVVAEGAADDGSAIRLVPFAIGFIWMGFSGLVSIAVRWLLLDRPTPVAQTNSPAQETATPQPYLVLHGRATAARLEDAAIDR